MPLPATATRASRRLECARLRPSRSYPTHHCAETGSIPVIVDHDQPDSASRTVADQPRRQRVPALAGDRMIAQPGPRVTQILPWQVTPGRMPVRVHCRQRTSRSTPDRRPGSCQPVHGGDQDLTTGLHRSPPFANAANSLSRNQCSYGQVTCTPNGSPRMPVWPGSPRDPSRSVCNSLPCLVA